MKAVPVLIVLYCVVSAVMSDTPTTPKGKGSKVVEEVSKMIENSNIFPADNKFLCRIAWVESKYGTAPGTYRPSYYGGIWQVDFIGYRDTVTRPSLKRYHTNIKSELNIDWKTTTWQDLEKPLYSGLAARLLLATVPAAIPPSSDIAAQGRYWKKYYNTAAGKGTVTKFVNDVVRATGCAK